MSCLGLVQVSLSTRSRPRRILCVHQVGNRPLTFDLRVFVTLRPLEMDGFDACSALHFLGVLNYPGFFRLGAIRSSNVQFFVCVLVLSSPTCPGLGGLFGPVSVCLAVPCHRALFSTLSGSCSGRSGLFFSAGRLCE